MLDTRERLVRAAYEVFLQQGFNAVGIDQILRKVGVTKTTFYNHFESKDDLVAAVLRWRNTRWPQVLQRIFEDRGVTDSAERVLLLVQAREEIWELPRNSTGVFTRAASEYPAGQGPVRQAIAEYRHTLEREFLKLATATGAPDPVGLAREIKFVIAAIAGMNLVGEKDGVDETAVRLAQRIIAQHVPKPAGKDRPRPRTRKPAPRRKKPT